MELPRNESSHLHSGCMEITLSSFWFPRSSLFLEPVSSIWPLSRMPRSTPYQGGLSWLSCLLEVLLLSYRRQTSPEIPSSRVKLMVAGDACCRRRKAAW